MSNSELYIPLKESTVGVLSTNTLNVELTLKSAKSVNLGEVMAIKPLRNEHMVLVAYEGENLSLWDIRQKSILSSLVVEKCPMALDFDSSIMKGVIGGPSNNLQIFNLSADRLLCDKSKVSLRNPGTSAITIRPDSKIVAVGGWDNRIRLFSSKNFKPLAVLNQHKDTVQDIAYTMQKVKTYDNKWIMATAAKDGYIALWDIYN